MRSFASLTVALLAALMLTFAAPTYTYAQMPDENTEVDFESDDSYTPDFDADTYERYRLPEGRRCIVDGVTYQCFALDEYVELLEMDVDLRFYDEAYPQANQRISLLEESEAQLRLALESAESEIQILEEERTRLINNWQEENRLRLEAENRPDLGSWIAWGLAAVEAVAVVILSVVLGVTL